MKDLVIFILLQISILAFGQETLDSEDVELRNERVLPLFNIIRFQNSPCGSGSRNGTCYTVKECKSRGGEIGDSCASGYGVCCLYLSKVTLACGKTSKENTTYLTQKDVSEGQNCVYTICRKNAWVCRLRFDFTSFEIANPVSSVTADGGATGDCITDAFSITGKQSGSPVICGMNSGQHMIVEAVDGCNIASFHIGRNADISRNWEIQVTQYNCGDDESPAGPSGCLQYFTEPSGVVESYNFPATKLMATMLGKQTHLSNQRYTLCIRRETGKCSICYTPKFDKGPVQSFAISTSTEAKKAMSGTGEHCNSDYLMINGAVGEPEANPSALTVTPRLCGRKFNIKSHEIRHSTVCSFSTPFRLTFVTDDMEVSGGLDAKTNEFKVNPQGSVGFSLYYFQRDCPEDH